MNLKSNQKGFTIVELLIVIVVIAILAAISIVAFTGIQQRGRDSQKASDASNIVKALTAYTTDGNPWPASATDVAGSGTPRTGGVLRSYSTANLSADILNKIGSDTPSTGSTGPNVYQYLPCPRTGTPQTGASIIYHKEQDGSTVNVNAGTGCPAS